ncbi:MAG: hypothetical protein ABIT37_04525 [Luteolibacter sp.]
MANDTIHIRSEDPDLLIEFDLPPGTHGRIGASPASEITLPLGGIPPFSCVLGRFHDGRLYVADLDGAISSRLDLPATLGIGPYDFDVFQPEVLQPEEAVEGEPIPPVTEVVSRKSGLSDKLRSVLALFANGGPRPARGKPTSAEEIPNSETAESHPVATEPDKLQE